MKWNESRATRRPTDQASGDHSENRQTRRRRSAIVSFRYGAFTWQLSGEFNGMVARERLVTLDDETCRLVYSVVEGQASHYNAAVQVFPEGDSSRVIWTIDLLPDELTPTIGCMMDTAAKVMRRLAED